MPRMARVVVPGFPHHVTQRGCRKQQTFFCDADYKAYLKLLEDRLDRSNVRLWTYCLMPNHIHAIVVPSDELGLARSFGQVHSLYARHVNEEHNWRGHLWQERFFSVAMDESHTLAAMRYVEMNPVRANLCDKPVQWPWSSVHANLGTRESQLVDTNATSKIVDNWSGYLAQTDNESMEDSLRKYTRTGRPAGNHDFVGMLEAITGRNLRCQSPGPPKR